MTSTATVRQIPFTIIAVLGMLPAASAVDLPTNVQYEIEYDAQYESAQPQFNSASPGPLRLALAALKAAEERVGARGKSPYGETPARSAFSDATTFMKSTNLNVAPLPDINIASDGELNFLWKQDGIHIDLGFYGNGKFSYYAESATGSPLYGDDISVAEGMPERLVRMFRS